jgi:hypothetical protein
MTTPSGSRSPLLEELKCSWLSATGKTFARTEARLLRSAAIVLALSFAQLLKSTDMMTDWGRTTISARQAQVINVSERPPHARTLLGIFSTRDPSGFAARQRHRAHFRSWNRVSTNHLVCSLSEWKRQLELRSMSSCSLVYVFVIGAAGNKSDKEAPAVNVDGARPTLAHRSAGEGADNPIEPKELADTILLNIRENSDEGKAQTWLKYSTLMVEKHDIDYIAKFEQGLNLDIEKYFEFSDRRLRPAPYNKGVFGGALRDKAFWKELPRSDVADVNRTDTLFFDNFHGHYYMEGTYTIPARGYRGQAESSHHIAPLGRRNVHHESRSGKVYGGRIGEKQLLVLRWF